MLESGECTVVLFWYPRDFTWQSWLFCFKGQRERHSKRKIIWNTLCRYLSSGLRTRLKKRTKPNQNNHTPQKAQFIYYYWDLFRFLLHKLHDGLAFCWWEIFPRRNVSLASSGNAQYPGDVSCLTFSFSRDYWAFAETREVIFLSLTSSSTCSCKALAFMLKAKLACDSGCTWACPPSACLSKTDLGWDTLAMFWWQVAQWALEIPVQYPAIAHLCFHAFSPRELGGQR